MSAVSALTSGLQAADYMKLLIVQLKNQNPEEPMSNSEMVTQMVQLSTLEETNKLNVNFKSMLKFERLVAAGSLVGREVEYVDNGGMSQGQVESADIKQDGVYVTVNGIEISSDLIRKIL